jgi:hypothetical protein
LLGETQLPYQTVVGLKRFQWNEKIVSFSEIFAGWGNVPGHKGRKEL